MIFATINFCTLLGNKPEHVEKKPPLLTGKDQNGLAEATQK